MEAIGNAIGVILKRPFILIFWGIVMLIFTLGSYVLPIFKTLYELSAISGSNSLESIMSFIQILYSYLSDIKIVIAVIIIFLILLAAVSILTGALLSGYFYILNCTVNKKQKSKGDFFTGMKKYFGPIWIVTFIILLAGSLLIIFMAISSVPALIITRASVEKGKQILPALLFVDVLTGVVLFFGLMFFRIYTFFWYPALINNEKRAFLKAKRFADKNFWKILNAIFIFDIIFVGFQMTFIKFDDNILFLILKWIFLTVFYALLTTYIFAAYKKYSEADRLKKA
ncbi:MAG TPA: hypothetical protein GX527_05010 [Clostridiaceae bacterium]|jgi:hypothetical protein|nr:hypothetical protein [Clostridiaceae bacterium]